MDLKEVKSLLEEDSRSDNKKCCADCKTTKTPLWRGGPAGPKSLCNACGIRHRKKRRLITSLEKRPDKKRQRTHLTIVKKSTPKSTTATATTIRDAAICDKSISGGGGSGNDNHQLSNSLKMNLMVALGEKVMLQRSSSAIVKKQRCQRRRRLGEEEQAAFCLMALSCGSVSA